MDDSSQADAATDTAPSREPDRRAARIVLVSSSPRRRRLLEWLGLPFSAASVETPESLDTALATDPAALAVSLAVEKALAGRNAGLGRSRANGDALIMCFDTIVVLDGRVLGKPADTKDAWGMLHALRGREHNVVTGVALLAPDQADAYTFAVTTRVAMLALTDGDIEEWMSAGTFMGCAGAYNIEAQVAGVTEKECYQNVAGLPLCHVYSALRNEPMLADWLPTTPTSPRQRCDEALARRCLLGAEIAAPPPAGNASRGPAPARD